MKTVLFFAAILLCISSALAQVPRTISYQGVLADASGNPLSDGSHTIRLKLYDVATGGTGLFAETHNVVTTRGVFNILLGAASGGIPGAVAFDRPYFLGVAVDGSPELDPRTPLTPSPYALRASVANALAPDAAGVVTSINGGGGAMILKGEGGTTINRSGDTITIASTSGSGGSGIQGIQSDDGSIEITNPNGPVATVRVAPGIIPATLPPSGAAGGDLAGTYPNPTIARIQGRSVSNSAPGNGQVLKFNGATWGPGSDDAGPWSTTGVNINNTNNGNVGIGTNSPATKLEINGTTRTRDLQITAGAASGRTLVSNASGTAVWTTDLKIVGGNVGIGDTTPKAKLHVTAGSSGFDPTFIRSMIIEEDGHLTMSLRGPTGMEQSILFERPVGDTGLRISSQPDGDMRIGRYRFTDNGSASSSFQLYLDVQTGNFGIKRDPVANDLEVDGSASKTTAGDWLANSDRRIKTDIIDIDESFSTMLKLRPVKFRYSDEWRRRNPSIEDRYYYNFIAQEYQQVFPDAVKGSGEYLEGNSQEILQIDTYDAQIVTIKAVQELIRENESLKKENAELQGRLDEIDRKLEKLQQTMGEVAAR